MRIAAALAIGVGLALSGSLGGQGRETVASLRDLEAAQLEQNDKWLAFLDADFARQQAQLELMRATGQVAQLAQ